MPACIDCAAATLRSQHWERPGVMRGWLRCTSDSVLDRIARYLSPFSDRDCHAYREIEDEQKASRRRQLDKIDREKAMRNL